MRRLVRLVRRLAQGGRGAAKGALLVAGALGIAPLSHAQSSSPVFIEGDRCTLSGPLAVHGEGKAAPVVLARGREIEVRTGGARISEVRERAPSSGEVPLEGLVENRALAKVCAIPRARCLLRAPLDVVGLERPGQEAKALRVQRGGTVVVLARERAQERARLLVGERQAYVGVSALLAACPSLARVFAEEDAALAKEAAKQAPAGERPLPASRPAAEDP